MTEVRAEITATWLTGVLIFCFWLRRIQFIQNQLCNNNKQQEAHFREVFLYLIKLIGGIWFIVKDAACSMLQQVPKARSQLSRTMTPCYRFYSGHQEASKCWEKRQKHQISSAGNRHSMCAKQRESSDVREEKNQNHNTTLQRDSIYLRRRSVF